MYFGKQTAPQAQKMNVCCPTQTCCGYAPLVTSDQILGAFDSSPALVRCLLNNDPHHRYNAITSLTFWNPNEAFEGDNQGLRTTLWHVYVGHSNVWIYYGCGFEIIKSLRIRPPLWLWFQPQPLFSTKQRSAIICFTSQNNELIRTPSLTADSMIRQFTWWLGLITMLPWKEAKSSRILKFNWI